MPGRVGEFIKKVVADPRDNFVFSRVVIVWLVVWISRLYHDPLSLQDFRWPPLYRGLFLFFRADRSNRADPKKQNTKSSNPDNL